MGGNSLGIYLYVFFPEPFKAIYIWKLFIMVFSFLLPIQQVIDSIKDCFVTGEWSELESAEKLLKMDQENDDLFGDFEDLETGEKFSSKEEVEKSADGSNKPG